MTFHPDIQNFTNGCRSEQTFHVSYVSKCNISNIFNTVINVFIVESHQRFDKASMLE